MDALRTSLLVIAKESSNFRGAPEALDELPVGVRRGFDRMHGNIKHHVYDVCKHHVYQQDVYSRENRAMEKMMHVTASRLFEAAKKVRPDIDTPADLARALNQSEQTINNWSYRGSGVSKQGRLLAQKELGISATWIEDGSGAMLTSEPSLSSEAARHSLPEDQGNVLVWEHPDDLPPDDNRVWLDRYDYRFSAGTGLIQWEIRQKKALPFDIGFFRALGSKPKDCRLVQVHGDSMEPYLFDRDMIMVDTAKSHMRDGKIYAIYFEGEPLVKQIFKQAGGLICLHSINASKYPDKIVTPELMESVTIMGEVIYRSGSGWAGGN